MLLRAVPRRFDDLLVEIRNGAIPPRVRAVENEVDAKARRPWPWGRATGGRGGSEAPGSASPEERDAREREAVEVRRRRNGLDVPDRATGLALLGGGIRSATFALGILSAFARRGLLQQFDFLSTGYLAETMRGDYLFGEELSAADCYLFVKLLWARKFGLTVPEELATLRDRMMTRPAVEKAMKHEGLI